jgi:hypothetical protein
MTIKYYYVIEPGTIDPERALFLIEPNTGKTPELEELQETIQHARREALEILGGSQAAERLGAMVADNKPWRLYSDHRTIRGGALSALGRRTPHTAQRANYWTGRLESDPHSPLDWWSTAEPEIENQAIADACIVRLRETVKELSGGKV